MVMRCLQCKGRLSTVHSSAVIQQFSHARILAPFGLERTQGARYKTPSFVSSLASCSESFIDIAIVKWEASLYTTVSPITADRYECRAIA